MKIVDTIIMLSLNYLQMLDMITTPIFTTHFQIVMYLIITLQC